MIIQIMSSLSSEDADNRIGYQTRYLNYLLLSSAFIDIAMLGDHTQMTG